MENKNLKEILISDLKRMYQMIEIMEPKNEAEFIAIALPNLHLALFEWIKSKQEEIERAMPEKTVSLIVMGFDGVTKKGVISEDGYEILCKEMEKRGYNQALDDLKPIISKILK